MKKILIPLTILISLVSIWGCNSDTVDKNTQIKSLDDAREISINKKKLEELSDKLSGYWLSDPYLINIESTKSIYDSRDYTTSMFGFILKKEEMMKNKAILQGFSSHEGGAEALLSYNPDKNIFENSINTGESYYFKKPFTLRVLDDQHLELSFPDKKERYRKVVDEADELRRLVLAGKYRDILSDTKIDFKRDGYVTGIPEYNFYEMYYDFGEGLWMDAVFFYHTDEKIEQGIYHYKIKNDTIRMYQVKGELPDYSLGELKYELVRVE